MFAKNFFLLGQELGSEKEKAGLEGNLTGILMSLESLRTWRERSGLGREELRFKLVPKSACGPCSPESVFFENGVVNFPSIRTSRSPTKRPAFSAAPPFPTSMMRISFSPSISRPVASSTPRGKSW